MTKRIRDSGSGIVKAPQRSASGYSLEPTVYSPGSLDRRTALKWVLAVAAALRMPDVVGAENHAVVAAKGYGKDPDLIKTYAPGQLWPLTLTEAQRKSVAALADAILPKEGEWPAASTVGVVEFVDEWISAPYPQMQEDRKLVVQGLEALDADAKRRYGRLVSALDATALDSLCGEFAPGPAQRKDSTALPFFARFRQLVAGAYYTPPQGMRDIGYVGNVPLASYDGPPNEVMEKVLAR